MTDLRKAAEMALEALGETIDYLPAKSGVRREVDDATQALRQALAQPEREWVGLTDDERFYCNEYPVDDCCSDSILRAEAKLKEKNT
jgi:hypothetical protein